MQEYRGELVLILAGYERPMMRFLEANPGLASPFATVLRFSDHTDEELVAIFEQMATDAGFTLANGVAEALRARFHAAPRSTASGNARLARTYLHRTITQQNQRIIRQQTPTLDEIRQLRPEDLPDIEAEAQTNEAAGPSL
jgi:hypothetical protein